MDISKHASSTVQNSSADGKSADCQLKCIKMIMIQSVGRRLVEIMADAYYFWIMSVSHALSS